MCWNAVSANEKVAITLKRKDKQKTHQIRKTLRHYKQQHIYIQQLVSLRTNVKLANNNKRVKEIEMII